MVAESTHGTIGILRVSKEAWDLDKNRVDILTLASREGFGRVEFVEEKASGRIAWRKRMIANVLDKLREGDAMIVSELSGLDRTMLECMAVLSVVSDAGIRVYAIKGAWRLDETIQSRIIALTFSMDAETERDLISARTNEALKARNTSGLPPGDRKGLARASSIHFVRRSKRYSRTDQPRGSPQSATKQRPQTSQTG